MELHNETTVRRLKSRSVKVACENETINTIPLDKQHGNTEIKDVKSLINQQRAALGDKSNHNKGKTTRLQQKKDLNTQQQQQKSEDEFNQILKDNEAHFKKEKYKPTAVLPIIAPKRIWDRYDMYSSIPQQQQMTTTTITVSSSTSSILGEVPTNASLTINNTNKRKLSSYLKPKYDMSEAAREMYEEALAYDQQLELRSEQARLQDPTFVQNCVPDPMLVAEYEEEIFEHLRKQELETLADPNYVSNHTEITWKMRGVLVDWVIEIHYLFQLLPETLFLAVNIIDRFLSKRVVALSKLQLVGIAALFIATKFEEVSSPRIKDFIWMTDRSLKEEELMKAERFVIQVLDFKLCYANPLNFLRRASKTEDYNVHSRMLAKYFMEISCVDHRFISVPPSKIAAASLWLSRRILTEKPWNDKITKLAGYKTAEIRPVVHLMLDYVSKPIVHDAFFRKWACKKMMRASVFVRRWVDEFYKNQ